jgi:hypothetical protein
MHDVQQLIIFFDVHACTIINQVDRRYNHYCDQMQMVVNFFDSVMGFGAATPYTALAQKAMSRHFRCLKDAIAAQLRTTCELLGEKDAGTSSGLTKGETPRLRAIDQSLRQQRAFHHMGMMEQEAWRPQRGLPERSVNILRSWLFEHFLHPYVVIITCLSIVNSFSSLLFSSLLFSLDIGGVSIICMTCMHGISISCCWR